MGFSCRLGIGFGGATTITCLMLLDRHRRCGMIDESGLREGCTEGSASLGE